MLVDNATRHDCPICGKRLVNSVANMVPRLERDGNGNLEVVQVYLCFSHGYYTFRRSRGPESKESDGFVSVLVVSIKTYSPTREITVSHTVEVLGKIRTDSPQ